jgi:uncharacterized protein with HEPN domain
MSDEALVREILRQILQATQTIIRRSSRISSPADFTASDAGMEKLDAICMQLIAIGESVKHLDRITQGALLSRYPGVEWKRVMGMRDVLTHHYFDMDAETVYEVCASHIPGLEQTIERILADLSS